MWKWTEFGIGEVGAPREQDLFEARQKKGRGVAFFFHSRRAGHPYGVLKFEK